MIVHNSFYLKCAHHARKIFHSKKWKPPKTLLVTRLGGEKTADLCPHFFGLTPCLRDAAQEQTWSGE
jgi:hypothetical protein